MSMRKMENLPKGTPSSVSPLSKPSEEGAARGCEASDQAGGAGSAAGDSRLEDFGPLQSLSLRDSREVGPGSELGWLVCWLVGEFFVIGLEKRWKKRVLKRRKEEEKVWFGGFEMV